LQSGCVLTCPSWISNFSPISASIYEGAHFQQFKTQKKVEVAAALTGVGFKRLRLALLWG
jgi:hypothetical protein